MFYKMKLLIVLLSAVTLQFSTAQILSYGVQKNAIGTPYLQNNVQRTISLPSNGIINNNIAGYTSSGLNNVNLPLSNNIQLNRNIGGSFIGNGNLGTNIVTSNLANNYANLANSNYGNAILSKNVVNANVPVNLANGFNINTGTFATKNNNLVSQLLGNRQCGIQIVADALEVAGAVGVNGQLPFYTTVAVNGNLPTSGSGIVGCACGGQGY